MLNRGIPRGAPFWSFLYTVDQELAEETREKGCSCGGRLHRANYPRKPRGCLDELPEEYSRRLSFCCDRDCCRKRETPPSVRFMGRKVYLGAMVILVCAMEQGATQRRVRELSNLIGVDRTTIARWQVFWREQFPQTKFWTIARARLVPVYEMVDYPLSIAQAFLNRSLHTWHNWEKLLRFLSPITTAKGLEIKLSAAWHLPAEDARRPF